MSDLWIRANELRAGQVIVSGYMDWGPNGEILPGEPYWVNDVSRTSFSGLGEVIKVRPRGRTADRYYPPNQPILIRCNPLSGGELQTLHEAVEVLNKRGYDTESEALRVLVEQHGKAHEPATSAPPSPFRPAGLAQGRP